MAKIYPYDNLLEDWGQTITTIVAEIKTISNVKKRHFLLLLLRKVRMTLIAFFAPIKCKWWLTKKVEIITTKLTFGTPIFEEDERMYQITTARMLANDVWWVIEGYLRKGTTEHNIRKILVKKFAKMPSGIDTLRLLKNCNHNHGIHKVNSGPDVNVTYKIGGWKFVFKNGKPIKNFHLASILKVVDQAVIEILELK